MLEIDPSSLGRHSRWRSVRRAHLECQGVSIVLITQHGLLAFAGARRTSDLNPTNAEVDASNHRGALSIPGSRRDSASMALSIQPEITVATCASSPVYM